MNEHRPKGHITTRRGFIAAAGFGVVSLYGLWAAYGAAPLPFGVKAHADDEATDAHAEGGGHGGHGASRGPTAQEFKRLTEAFIAAHKLPDDSVQVARAAVPPIVAAALALHAHTGTGAHAHPAPAADAAQSAAKVESAPADGPLDVYLMAYQWGYAPSVIRLERDVPYRFRMMAVDVTHGAALRVGSGSRILRLRPGVLVEPQLRFTRAGEYLVYCTTYCGLVHDRMQGRIIVT